MDTVTIIQDLNRRFAQPLPEFYARRVIFWYDGQPGGTEMTVRYAKQIWVAG